MKLPTNAGYTVLGFLAAFVGLFLLRLLGVVTFSWWIIVSPLLVVVIGVVGVIIYTSVVIILGGRVG